MFCRCGLEALLPSLGGSAQLAFGAANLLRSKNHCTNSCCPALPDDVQTGREKARLSCGASTQRCLQNAPGLGGKLFSRHWRAFSCAVSNAVVILYRRRYSALYRRRYSALYWRRYSAPSALACFAIFSTLLRYGVTVMTASLAVTSEKLVLWKSHLCEAHHT